MTVKNGSSGTSTTLKTAPSCRTTSVSREKEPIYLTSIIPARRDVGHPLGGVRPGLSALDDCGIHPVAHVRSGLPSPRWCSPALPPWHHERDQREVMMVMMMMMMTMITINTILLSSSPRKGALSPIFRSAFPLPKNYAEEVRREPGKARTSTSRKRRNGRDTYSAIAVLFRGSCPFSKKEKKKKKKTTKKKRWNSPGGSPLPSRNAGIAVGPRGVKQ